MTRRRFLAAAGALAALGSGAGIYARYVEPEWLRRVTVDVPLRGMGEPVHAVHLTDFHASNDVPYSLIGEAIELALEAGPDVVFLTGDFITGRIPDPAQYVALLRRLSGAVPVLACLGNHDGGSWARSHGGYETPGPMQELLGAAGVECLRNRARTLKIRSTKLHVAGLGDIWADDADPAAAFRGREAGEDGPTILLSHNPDSKKAVRAYPWDLMLSGHTHGGQLALPLLGTPFAPVRDHRYVRGLNPWEDRLIHTSSGVGNLFGVRLNCRPEVNILSLVPA